jgi:hypothetical protein
MDLARVGRLQGQPDVVRHAVLELDQVQVDDAQKVVIETQKVLVHTGQDESGPLQAGYQELVRDNEESDCLLEKVNRGQSVVDRTQRMSGYAGRAPRGFG